MPSAYEKQVAKRRKLMPKHKIALLPGDGIGRDVIEAAKIVLGSNFRIFFLTEGIMEL